MERLKLAVYLALTISSLPCLLRASLNPEAGAFVFHAYSAKDYSASIQNWSTVQDRTGVLYFGNNDGVLSYDGVNWKLTRMPNGTVAQSLAVGPNGVIYVGGSGEFGYLQADPKGLTRFVSLLGRVVPADRNFGRVWDTIATPEGVYFGAFERIFRLNPDGSIQVFRPKTGNFNRIFRAGTRIYVYTPQDGFLSVAGNSLRAGLSGRHFNDEGITGSCQLGDATIIASGRDLYRLAGNSVEPFPTEIDDYLRAHQIYTVYALRTGDIAVGTHTGGLVLLTSDGHLDRLVDKAAGAPSNGIISLYTDRQGGVWLTTDDSGLARFDPSLTQFGVSEGIDGILNGIDRYNGSLYAGGNKGLYRLNAETGKSASFELFQGLNEMVGVVLNYGAEALVGAQHGLYELNGPNKLQRILETDIKRQVWDLAKSNRDIHVIYGAGRDGVYAVRQLGERWRLVGKVDEAKEFRTVAEDSDGHVWATTDSDIWRFDFASQAAKAERFTDANGVPPGWKSVFRFNGHVVFATTKGLMTFASADRRFVPDNEAGARFADGSHGVSLLAHDSERNIWITGNGYNGILRRQGAEYDWEPMPLLGTGIQEVFSWAFDRDGVAWASGASKEVYRWDTRLAKDPNEDFDLQIESVKTPSQEYGGTESLHRILTLPYQENELTFAFAAPSYEAEPASVNQTDNGPEPQHVEYQFRLAGAGGKEAQWSKWTMQTQKDLNNLWEHSYSFEVRARNPHGVVTVPAIFRFKVLPPWYRTWWAYLLYLAGTVLTGWRLFRWRVRILEENNRRLEQTVEERTIEVRQQRDQNEALLLNILPKPVATELRSTGAVTPMTFDDVTVCFTDFVGFTLSSEQLPAETLVTALNQYFTAFDEITGRYGLEKLKTIGDSYMFVSGLPEPRASHAVDAVLAALEMVEVVKKLSQPGAPVNWKVRVGLFSGPVVAGVVGVRKFAFDVWGNTVNFAARMESSGAANRVNVSAVTWERVRRFIDCEARGPVKIKEGRFMEMYFALGPTMELMQGNTANGIPDAFGKRYEQEFGVPPRSFPSMVEIPTA